MYPKRVDLALDVISKLGISTFCFECSEKTLCCGIVITISHTAHAGQAMMVQQALLVGKTGILASLIGVMDKTWARVAAGQSHTQCIIHQ